MHILIQIPRFQNPIRLLSYLLLAMFVLVGCNLDDTQSLIQVDPCETMILEDQLLSDESIEFFSYQNVNLVVFKDSLGNEYPFEVVMRSDSLIEVDGIIDCDEVETLVSTKRQLILTEFRNISNIDTTWFRVYQTVNFPVIAAEDKRLDYLSDYIGVAQFRRYISDPNIVHSASVFSMMVTNRGGNADMFEHNTRIDFQDSYTIHGQTFNDVYVDKTFGRKIYLTKAQGLVSFTTHTNQSYYLDRLE